MEIQKTGYTPSFRALITGNSSEIVNKAIKSSKALQKFGKEYDAQVCYSALLDSNDNNIVHPAILVSEIKPANLYRKIVDFFAGRKAEGSNFFFVKTHGTTDKELLKKLEKLPNNALFEMYNSIFKRINMSYFVWHD